MKLNSNFKLRHIAGETIIINQGTPDVDFTRIISLNSSARFLWNKFCGKEFSVDEVGCHLANFFYFLICCLSPIYIFRFRLMLKQC